MLGASHRGVLSTWRYVVLLLLPALGCAEAFGQTDDYPQKLQQGCGPEERCRLLVDEAEARVARCQPNTIGYIRCDDARADLIIAKGMLREATTREQRKDKAQREALERQRSAEREARAQERQFAIEQEEAERRAASRKLYQERAAKAEAEWPLLNVAACETAQVTSDCDSVRQYVNEHPDSPHAPEATAAIRKGEAAILAKRRADEEARQEERERQAAELGRAEQKRLKAEEDRRRAAPPVRSNSGSGGNVCCCDGTVSPTCTYVKRGCCSHHGGVCAC